MLPEDKKLQNDYEYMTKTAGWIHFSQWLKEQADWERLSGATKDNFEGLQGEIKAYKSVLNEVDKFLNIKYED